MELNFLRNDLLSAFGITCPVDCFCYDPDTWTLVQKGRKLYETIITLANEQEMTEEAVLAGDKLLDIYRRLNVSWYFRGFVEHNLFQIAIRKSGDSPQGQGAHPFGC